MINFLKALEFGVVFIEKSPTVCGRLSKYKIKTISEVFDLCNDAQ